MKLCIAFLFIACVAPAVFAGKFEKVSMELPNIEFLFGIFLSAELTGPARFSAASQNFINSRAVPPQVKPIFQRFLAAVAGSKPCVANANLQCILRVFKDVGITGMQQGIRLSYGPLQQLFQKMLRLDQKAVSDMSALPANAGQTAVKIADNTLNAKATLLNQYLGI